MDEAIARLSFSVDDLSGLYHQAISRFDLYALALDNLDTGYLARDVIGYAMSWHYVISENGNELVTIFWLQQRFQATCR